VTAKVWGFDIHGHQARLKDCRCLPAALAAAAVAAEVQCIIYDDGFGGSAAGMLKDACL
jgi:hypothetical protein